MENVENAEKVLTQEDQIIATALREYYERKYKLYKANNDLPVTEEEFTQLRTKAQEIKEIREIAEKYGAL